MEDLEMENTTHDTSPEATALAGRAFARRTSVGVAKGLFVRLRVKEGKGDEVEAFLRSGLDAVMEEDDTTTWYALRFGPDDFAIFDTFPDDAGRLAHLAGKVGRELVARSLELFEGAPEIRYADLLAYKLPDQSGQVVS
ncbi:putative quinol monooxygenase [Rhizobium sp. YIM 134829]|uniref:putative quinol monooxygenase n=1 Tax=Rhizobium sp. YIM 134829 TaxID=3390453 RepID=UPI00397C1655